MYIHPYTHIHTCVITRWLSTAALSRVSTFFVVNLLNLLLPPFLQEAAERLTLFTAEEEIFAFQRTASRIMEMQTEKYWREGDRSSSKKHTSA